MKKINIRDVPWEDWSSPGGKFHGSGQALSLALGAKENAIATEGGHPFDLEHARLRPGKSGCPFHSHATQFELYVITAGRGTVRFGAERREVRAGDAMMHPPGEAHQLINTGDTVLEYFLVADNPAVDVYHYPDSNKWGFRPRGGIFLRTDVDYHVGEEEGAEQRPPRPAPPPLEHTLARFVTIAAIPEVERRSPKGRYHSFVRDISLSLGGIRNIGPWGGGHPFDVQQRRVPPGAAVCPLHVHTTESELFVALAGTATVRRDGEEHSVVAGDVFFQPPGTAHQIINHGSEDFVFYVIADNVPAEICYYPDSRKWAINPQRKIFRMVEVDYFDGEE
jgi:uncharacterized cupin superfamily protein